MSPMACSNEDLCEEPSGFLSSHCQTPDGRLTQDQLTIQEPQLTATTTLIGSFYNYCINNKRAAITLSSSSLTSYYHFCIKIVPDHPVQSYALLISTKNYFGHLSHTYIPNFGIIFGNFCNFREILPLIFWSPWLRGRISFRT